MQMETAGVQSQWQKRLLLQKNLPPDIIEEWEDEVEIQKMFFGNNRRLAITTPIVIAAGRAGGTTMVTIQISSAPMLKDMQTWTMILTW